jgi:rubrerythrin
MQRELLKKALEVIEDYLNAGCKESRTKAAKKAKEVYKEYHGKEYQNKNEMEQSIENCFPHRMRKHLNEFTWKCDKCGKIQEFKKKGCGNIGVCG